MEAKFVEDISAIHHNLRRRYFTELIVTLLILLVVSFAFVTANLLVNIGIWEYIIPPVISLSVIAFLVLFCVVYLPLRFKCLQKALNLKFFALAKSVNLTLIPNPLGSKEYDYYALMNKAGLNIKNASVKAVVPYEFDKRLFNVIYVLHNGENSAVIHLPSIESPYYIQISNGNYAPPEKYNDMRIVKIAYVSPHKLHYYASSSATNAKIYLRKENETRFIKFLKIHEATYQYISTFSDEFLKIEGLTAPSGLRLGEKYDSEHYLALLQKLRLLQNLMSAMLERGH